MAKVVGQLAGILSEEILSHDDRVRTVGTTEHCVSFLEQSSGVEAYGGLLEKLLDLQSLPKF
jgi:hypothetical protein